MKEITRIHIAKVAYDIELTAKKQLEGYLKALESYGGDSEIINDIEIRMTEILTDRGVRKGAVISAADITALQDQLGKPSEIMGGDELVLDDERSARKLFRDTDTAVIGGVLAGISIFFNVNVIWVRLIFIALALMSGGAILLVYLVLWIVIPVARTAADKLQMRGQAVTAASIKRFNETDQSNVRTSGVSGRKIGLIILGSIASLGALTSLGITLTATAAALLRRDEILPLIGEETGLIVAAFICAVASGLLLGTLFIISAYAAFSQKMTRRIAIAIGAIIVLGLVSFGTSIGFAQYAKTKHEAVIQANTRETAIALPVGSQNSTSVDVDVTGARVVYSVTDGPMKATLQTVGDQFPSTVNVAVKNANMTISYASKETVCTTPFCRESQPVITIEGPAMSQLHIKEDTSIEYGASHQDALLLDAANESKVRLTGSVNRLVATAARNAYLDVGRATIQRLEVSFSSIAELNAGTVGSFTMNYAKACGQDDHSVIVIDRVSDGQMKVNNEIKLAETVQLACANIMVRDKEER